MSFASIPREDAPQAPAQAISPYRWLSRQLIDERERWLLWLPVGFGAGIALYFALPGEPPLWVGAMIAAAATLSTVVVRRTDRMRPVFLAASITIAIVAAGFTAVQVRSAIVAAPVLANPLNFVEIDGTVVSARPVGRAARLILTDVTIESVRPADTPARIRIRVSGNGARNFAAGDRISASARLLPPPGPAAPGAFDFQRRAWFARIGAVGFSFGIPTRVTTARDSAAVAGWRERLASWRAFVFQRVTGRIPGPSGAVAAALMTGERGAIPPDVLAAVRDAGLAHLLAISGLHIGLVAGFVFLVVRGGLALLPDLALTWPLKKIAAILAILAAFAYMLLAGASVPTQRAVVMTGIVLVAILADRTAISMRLVAWAAVVVLVFRPETLIGASFQMSFAAVVALVAVYEALGRRLRLVYGGGTTVKRLLLYLVGVVLTTIVATLATAPFVLFHFNQIAAYGLLANLVAVPLTAVWVMPLGVLALLAMPIGLDSFILVPMGWGIDVILLTAEKIADWPGAVQRLPRMPAWGLAAATLGGVWLCLMQRPWRWAGLVGLAATLAAVILTRPPDILIAGDGNLIAIRLPDGGYRFSSLRRASFTRDAWLRQVGQARPLAFPEASGTHESSMACGSLGCVLQHPTSTVALVSDPLALPEDCAIARIVVAPSIFLPHACNQPAHLVDRGDLLTGGSHAIYLGKDGTVTVVSDTGQRGSRPWVAP